MYYNVPQLGSNGCSALHLTEHRQFRVIISKGNIAFIRDGKTLFNATVEESNVAKLDGLIQIQTALVTAVDRMSESTREHSSVRGEDDAFSAQRLVLNTTTGRSRMFLQRALYLQESFHSETMGIAQRDWQCEV